jgi:hypothetical protein
MTTQINEAHASGFLDWIEHSIGGSNRSIDFHRLFNHAHPALSDQT